MKPLAILGPTAVGKSFLATDLAERLGGEIVSIDSRQVYRGIDIGTAKPSLSDRARVPHHLIDVIDLAEKIDAERFARMADKAIEGILQRGGVPILTGGSGLYFRALLHGFFDISLDPAERAAFAESVASVATAELFGRLQSADPDSARRIHPNDRYRIIRALEVCELSGTPISEHFRRQSSEDARKCIEHAAAGLTMQRGRLYERINARTRAMMAGGWIEEVRELLDGGADPAWPGLESLGYPEVISLIRGELTREETIERVATQTRRYAKRQLTWFRKVEGVTWFDAERPDLIELVLAWFRAGDG